MKITRHRYYLLCMSNYLFSLLVLGSSRSCGGWRVSPLVHWLTGTVIWMSGPGSEECTSGAEKYSNCNVCFRKIAKTFNY